MNIHLTITFEHEQVNTSNSTHELTRFVIMTLFPFYKNTLQFSG